MSNCKKFMELVTNDENVKSELENATLDALMALLEAKGLKDEAQQAIECAFNKTAETHGFKLDAMDEISDNELQAVAGGGWRFPVVCVLYRKHSGTPSQSVVFFECDTITLSNSSNDH